MHHVDVDPPSISIALSAGKEVTTAKTVAIPEDCQIARLVAVASVCFQWESKAPAELGMGSAGASPPLPAGIDNAAARLRPLRSFVWHAHNDSIGGDEAGSRFLAISRP